MDRSLMKTGSYSLVSLLCVLFIWNLHAFGQEEQEQGGDAFIVPLKGINSKHVEFAPVITVDEELIFFTSDRPVKGENNGSLNIFFSNRKKDGSWDNPKPLSLNTPDDEVTAGLSMDGRTLFLRRDGDIFRSQWSNGEWQKPEKLVSVINSKASESHGMLSPDGRTFYFVSDRKGSLGGTDIYRVRKLPTGEWSKALNLGKPVNTEEDEKAPFIHADGKTLFFSSEGHGGKGGSDIFYSKKNQKGEWSDPENMGYPLSTEGDDIYIVTSADGKRAYFSSDQLEEGKGKKDLFRVDLPEIRTEGLSVLKGFVDVPKGSDVLDSTMIYIDGQPDGSSGSKKVYRPRQRDGVFIAILPPCNEYGLDYTINGRKVMGQKVSIPCNSSYQEIRQEVFLRPLQVEEGMVNMTPDVSGRVLHAGNNQAVNEGMVYLVDEEGAPSDSVRIGKEGKFLFYNYSGTGKDEVLFRVLGHGNCSGMELLLKSGKDSYKGERKEGCSFTFKVPPEKLAPSKGSAEKAEEKGSKEGKSKRKKQPSQAKDKITEPERMVTSYEKHFGYNANAISSSPQKLKRLIHHVAWKASQGQNVEVSVTGSASRVPTSSFPSNKALAQERAERMKTHLTRELSKKNVDMDKVTIRTKGVVEGPEYESGKDISYREYQYVRVRIEK